jgi:hypothetical protein
MDCSLIRTRKFLGSLFKTWTPVRNNGITGIYPWIRKQLVHTGRRKHRTFLRPSFFGTGRSTLLTESSGIGKKRNIVNEAQAHAKSTCHIPKEITPLPIPFLRLCIALSIFPFVLTSVKLVDTEKMSGFKKTLKKLWCPYKLKIRIVLLA